VAAKQSVNSAAHDTADAQLKAVLGKRTTVAF
jgi:hypothetical protein